MRHVLNDEQKYLPCPCELQIDTQDTMIACILKHKDNNQASFLYLTHTHVNLNPLVWVLSSIVVSCFSGLMFSTSQSNQAVIPLYSNQIFAAQLNILPMHTDM